VIASGPTVPDRSSAAEALDVLERFAAREAGISERVFAAIRRSEETQPAPTARVTNLVIGNNALAVDAAGMEAERRGYSHAMISAAAPEGPAEEVGRHLAELALRMRQGPGPDCLISGGEPVVSLVEEVQRGLGGRNQQLALAALDHLGQRTHGIVLLSGGTDGEDGPTDAAGGLVDAGVAAEASRLGLSPADFLRRNDAYRFLEQTGGLVKTGPTGTNVCDVRVVLVDRCETNER
jgi:glycerate-2-kinase